MELRGSGFRVFGLRGLGVWDLIKVTGLGSRALKALGPKALNPQTLNPKP